MLAKQRTRLILSLDRAVTWLRSVKSSFPKCILEIPKCAMRTHQATTQYLKVSVTTSSSTMHFLTSSNVDDRIVVVVVSQKNKPTFVRASSEILDMGQPRPITGAEV